MIFKSIVVDTNLIFSALLSKNSKIRDILFDNRYTFYAPNYLIIEIYKHKDKLYTSSKLNDTEFYLYFNQIVERITFLPLELISTKSRQKAYDLCKKIDLKDTPFVAISVELGIPFWTGDKKLKNGLISKGFKHFFPEREVKEY